MSRPGPPLPSGHPPRGEPNDEIIKGLKHYYRTAIKPLEAAYKFEAFHSPHLTDTDFDAPPMVLLMGQYSTGKTSFIRYLVEKDFANMRIGPEPTTDCFTAVMYGSDERVIPGNALAVMADKPFSGTQQFGMGFLNKFEGVLCSSPILQKLMLIDTPGVLSGEKQRIGRAYNFSQVVEWFAGRADRILLLFDAHKLDISDEFKNAIEALAGQDDKIRCILNKADSVGSQQLMRVYGSLMWSLGRVIRTPEVLRVFIGSFWHQPLKNKDNAELLKAEEADLIADLRSLPRNSAVRKVNELVKRARMAIVHAYIVNHLREQFGWFGKDGTQKKVLDNITEMFKQVQQKYGLPTGDFPNPHKFREIISQYPIHAFPKLDPEMIKACEQVLSVHIPNLMRLIPSTGDAHHLPIHLPPTALPPGKVMPRSPAPAGGPGSSSNSTTASSASASTSSAAPPLSPMQSVGYSRAPAAESPSNNPFDVDPDREEIALPWAIDQKTQTEYSNKFYDMKLVSGKLPGSAARDIFMATGLTTADLRTVWRLADIDKDGALDCDEYVLAEYLIDRRRRNPQAPLPAELELGLVPPSKRSFVKQM